MTEVVNADVPEIEPIKEAKEERSADVADDDQKPVFNKYQVRDAIQRERHKAYEKGKREALMELQQQNVPQQQPVAQDSVSQGQQPKPQEAPQIGGMQQMSPDLIKQMISEHAPKAIQEHVKNLQQQQLVNSFVAKMQASEAKYPGLEAKLNELNYESPAMVKIVEYVNNMDNAGDVMNELIENPSKMGNLFSLINDRQTKLAERNIQSLSSSIKTNTDAQSQEKTSQDPFGQLKPSNNAGKDDGDMSVTDFQAMFKKQKRR